MNNGLLPVQVSEEFLKALFSAIDNNPSVGVTVSLEDETISIEGTDLKESFEINAYKKYCMIQGYDDIDFLISKKEEIEEFETKQK